LTVTEFLIVQALASRPGVVKSRDAPMDVAYHIRMPTTERSRATSSACARNSSRLARQLAGWAMLPEVQAAREERERQQRDEHRR
jgi:hypothetical protein